jgi:hypothetical protein
MKDKNHLGIADRRSRKSCSGRCILVTFGGARNHAEAMLRIQSSTSVYRLDFAGRGER